MPTSRERPNPLRPYYKPPSIGITPEIVNTPTSTSQSIPIKNGTTASIRASARDMFSDIDYSDYLSDSSPSSMRLLKDSLDQALLKYMSVFLGQPFDVAKTILQVRSPPIPIDGPISLRDLENKGRRPAGTRESRFSEFQSDEDSDADEHTYFTSSTLSSSSNNRYSSRQRQPRNRGHYRSSSASSSPSRHVLPSQEAVPTHQLVHKLPDSIMDVIGQVWQKEGAWGTCKGTNVTFVYSILLKTLESWARGVMAAVLNVPDPGIIAGSPLDLGESPYPWASLGVAVIAAAIAGIALAPLDLIRTKLIVTPISSPKRSLLQNLRNLPSYVCAPSLFMPTLLNTLINPTITHGAPLFLRSRLGIDATLTPTSFSVAKIASSTVELFLRLPLETVLRRGQVAVLASKDYSGENKFETIVEVGPYKGVMGTMWSIVNEEGTSARPEVVTPAGGKRPVRKINRPPTKGQGIEGLWRGWRVGMWGIIGLWGAEMMGGGGGSGSGQF